MCPKSWKETCLFHVKIFGVFCNCLHKVCLTGSRLANESWWYIFVFCSDLRPANDINKPVHAHSFVYLTWSELAVKGNNLPFLGLTAWFPIPAEVSALDTCSQDKLSDSMTRLGNNAVRHRPLKTLSCFIDFLSDIWFYLNFNSVLHQFFIRALYRVSCLASEKKIVASNLRLFLTFKS